MAVSFNVPKSPKRDVAVSDTFMGVDLTNTGANIDGFRSPNAENMIRFVPGKVRKRMGYYKDVLFGKDENVNFAANTSSVEKGILITDTGWVKIYDLIQTIASKDGEDYLIFLEFDYKAEKDFSIINSDTLMQASEEWKHYSGSISCDSAYTLSDVQVQSNENQTIYIKNFSLLRDMEDNISSNLAVDASARVDEIVFEEGSHDNVKVYDVSRLLPSLSAGDYKAHIEFDYTAEKKVVLMPNSIEGEKTLEPAQPDPEGNWPHYSADNYFHYIQDISIFSYASQGQTIQIKNFSITPIERDDEYDPLTYVPFEWSPAPHHFVERETNDPVYGYHTLKRAGVTDGEDRIVNVNRVLNTHDYFDEFVIPMSTEVVPPGEVPVAQFMPIYRLAERPPYGQTIYVEFDYESDHGIYMEICGIDTPILTLGHVSLALDPPFGSWVDDSICVELDFDYDINLKIKNLSVVYEKDENFKWSPAPEDVKEKSHYKDMFKIYPAELTSFTAYEGETSASTTHIEKTIDIGFNQTSGRDVFVSFDITTSLTNPDAKLKEMTTDATPYGMTMGVWGENICSDYTDNFRKKHIELYLHNRDPYPISNADLNFDFYVTGGSTKVNISISNFSARGCEPRTDYTVHSRWDLYHVGKDFYLRANDLDTFTKVYSDANEHISKSWQLNNKAYIIDGKDIYQFSIEDGEDVRPITKEVAYIPKVTIAKEPTGGGTTLEALNLLQPGFYELFQGKANVKDYQLSFSDLDDDKCKAWVMDQSGNWIEKEEDTDFTVNRETGKITFTTAPGVTPIDGEDNVKILAYRTVEGYRDRIVKCIVGTLFGVGGAGDRLFLTGNIDHPNWDFYSQQYDPTYFPDLGYSVLGSEQSKIMGYAIVDNYLTTFKDGFDPSQSVFVREGDMLKNEETGTSDPVFKLINTLQGEGVVAPYSFGYLQTEPLFLTKGGVYAITEQDITGQKYSQNRSFYLDGKLRKETGLEKAMAAVYDNQYILALNNKLYVLDGLQATRTDKSEPYATRQYAGFYCTNIPATCVWTDDALCFGTEDGRVCRFYTDEEALASYNDDGQPIYSCWETPDLDGHLFYKNKTFRYIAVRLMRAIKTSVKLYSRKLGVWTLNKEDDWSFIKEDNIVQNALNFEDLDFEMFTFSIDGSEKVVHSKLRVKKVDKARFRVENDKLNEPFGIFDIALEYIESGNYKG